MDPRYSPYVVASHWPYLDAQLDFGRAHARRRALQLLAALQVDAGGDPVRLGRARLRELGLSNGEAVRVTASLRELEARNVVELFAGAGSRPAAWSFRPGLERWRAMPWRVGARTASDVVFSCAGSRVCEAVLAFVNHFPDQGPRRAPKVLLGSAAHLYRSGETPVEMLHGRADRFTDARRRAWAPVDPLHYAGPLGAASPISGSTYVDLSVSRQGRQETSILQEAFEAAGGGRIFEGSKRWPELLELVARLTVEQLEEIAQDVANANRGREHKLRAPLLLTRAQELARSPAILALAPAPLEELEADSAPL